MMENNLKIYEYIHIHIYVDNWIILLYIWKAENQENVKKIQTKINNNKNLKIKKKDITPWWEQDRKEQRNPFDLIYFKPLKHLVWKLIWRVPIMTQQLVSIRMWAGLLASPSGLRIRHCRKLWCKVTDEAQIRRCCGCGVGCPL